MTVFRKSVIGVLAGAFLATAAAAEVPAGTVISAQNIDQMKGETFQGKKIGDMITDKFEMWVRNYGLTMELAPTTALKYDPAYDAATKANVGKTTIDPSTKLASGYAGGVPFPDLKLDDPLCGWKAAYNNWLGNPVIGDSWAAFADVYITTKDRGLIDTFGAASAITKLKGRTAIQTGSIGADQDQKRYLLVLTRPYDIAGIGVFNKSYNSGQVDDGWVYLRNLRRTRRTAGGAAWMDPQPKMDLLNDDNQGILGNPAWFQDWKCVGKRTVLAVFSTPVNSPSLPIEQYYDMKTAPHWNMVNVKWEPREVYVVEATPPSGHPYGKKVMYLDAQYPIYLHGELYDNKGDFWRLWRQSYSQATAATGQPTIHAFNTQAIDFQRERATYINQTLNAVNCLGPDWFDIDTLEKAAGGALEKEMDACRKGS